MSLGAPSQNYYGMLIDNVKQEYLIPVRTSVHTHIPDFGNNGGISINNDPGVSDGYKYIANLIQGNSTAYINMYVAEVKDDGKFLVASYTKTSTDYTIEADNLLLPNVCNFIN